MPGIGYSDDKLLQTRIFSYADTQRHRLGPNYLLLPANAPRSAHHNNHHDGAMNFTHRDEEVNYFPSRMDPVRNAARTPTNPMPFSGKRERAKENKNLLHFNLRESKAKQGEARRSKERKRISIFFPCI